jgi:AcrR family transcriptional regulator
VVAVTERPLRADAARNRKKVLAAARAAFADEGVTVPLDEIARRAGVGAGTVYRHFPTKEALFEAVILDRLQALADYGTERLSADDPGAALFEFMHRMLSGSTQTKDLVDALAGANIDTSGLITAAKTDLHRVGGELLARAQKAGAVRDDVGVLELMTLITGASLALRQQPTDPTLRESVFTVLRDGLRR